MDKPFESMEIPTSIIAEFKEAANQLSQQYTDEITAEKLIVWLLSGITLAQIIDEFQHMKKQTKA